MPPDENGAMTAEEKFTPKLPKQVQDQVDAVNRHMEAQDPPEDEQEYEEEGEEEGEDEQPSAELQPESWEQRARSAQGRLERTLESNQQLSRRVSDLENQLTGKKLTAKQEDQPYAKQNLIKEEERSDYGEEFFDVVGRRAREEFSPELFNLGQRLQRLEGKQEAVTQVIDRTQKTTVYDQLYDEVPMWKEINHHPAFKNWLTQLDPYSGRPLGQMLSEAMDRHDAPRVVNFFRGFAEAAGLPLNSSSPEPAAPPLTNGNGSERPSLEDYAAPGRARSVPQTLPPEKPTYSTAQIARLSDEKRRGLWRGRESDLEAIERDIFAAQHEGRIQ